MKRRAFLKMLAGTGCAVPFAGLRDGGLAHILNTVASLDPRTPEQDARDEDFWLEIQQAFDVDRSQINLNNGGVCPSPRVVNEALKQYIDTANKAPAVTMWRWQEPHIETVRIRLAKAFGCDKEEIAVTRNASEALGIALNGISLKPGDEVITTNQDYPRMINMLKQRVERDGIELKMFSVPTPPKSLDELYDAFERNVTPKTKLILICHVVNLTGQIFPVKKVCRMARERGIECVVDGAHAFAHFPFKHTDLDCDYYGTSLHKWLTAPIGTGFLYVRRKKIRDLWPLMAAPAELCDNIRKFEEIGTHPAANHNAISEALTFYEGIGAQRKAARLRYLRQLWVDKLKGLDNVEFHTNLLPEHSCGLCNVEIKGVDPGKLATYLYEKHSIIVTPIEHPEFRGIRVTPNVYTTPREIEIFAEQLVQIAKKGLPV
jgi:selenocysteine lyase/cysteine desulfurase